MGPLQVTKQGSVSSNLVGKIAWKWGHLFVLPTTASQAAARARSSAGQHSAAASQISGMTLQEAQQILNVSTLNPEDIEKVAVHSYLLLLLLAFQWKNNATT